MITCVNNNNQLQIGGRMNQNAISIFSATGYFFFRAPVVVLTRFALLSSNSYAHTYPPQTTQRKTRGGHFAKSFNPVRSTDPKPDMCGRFGKGDNRAQPANQRHWCASLLGSCGGVAWCDASKDCKHDHQLDLHIWKLSMKSCFWI